MKVCAYCRQTIPVGMYPFTLRLELFHAVEETLEIDQTTLTQDLGDEMQRLIAIMEKMTDLEVEEEEKRMYVSYAFTLCRPCRDRLAHQLERLNR